MDNIVIIGGGAAGFFAAINLAEKGNSKNITILEKSNKVLSKVKISGGGRCNVTHACFDPKELTQFYPRGGKELLGPFHQFMTGDTMQWFEQRNVPLKIEEDNRVFPVSNSSQSIIDVLLNEAKRLGVIVKLGNKVTALKHENNTFIIKTTKGNFTANKLLIASGSNAKIWQYLADFGHTIVKPIPSLFTFNCKDERIKELPGVSVPFATVKVVDSKLVSQGPLLITHWGLSGPAILKLSAFGARLLADYNYKFSVRINWLSLPLDKVENKLKRLKKEEAKKHVFLKSPFDEISKRLWQNFLKAVIIKENLVWADLSNKQLNNLAIQLTSGIFNVTGKSTFKEEFVMAGGVNLKEVNFKRFESKIFKNLFFAGEVLNIDGVTGGFNFQNAWTGAYIAAKAMSEI